MVVSQTANDLQGYTDFNAPIINQRQADTTVSVKDSETIVLGGIIRSTVTSNVRKVPLLGDIPLLGELFRSTTKGKQKTELIVFLTPRVVKDADDARLLRDRVKGQLSPGQQKQIDRELGKITPNSAKPVEKTKGEAKPGGTTSDPNKTGKGGQ
jgi:general secretion pathway protein D